MPRLLGLALHLFDCREHRLGHQHHTGPASKGPVIDAVVPSSSPVANVPQMNFNEPTFQCQLEDTLLEIPVENLRKQGQDVEAHAQAGDPAPVAAAEPAWPAAACCSNFSMYFFSKTATFSEGLA